MTADAPPRGRNPVRRLPRTKQRRRLLCINPARIMVSPRPLAPCLAALVSNSFRISASGIASSFDSSPDDSPQTILTPAGKVSCAVLHTAATNSSDLKRVAWVVPYSTRCAAAIAATRAAGLVEDLLRFRRADLPRCRRIEQRLHHLHVVLDAMIELVEQHALMRFRLLALADVDQHVDGADDLAFGIAQRRRIGNERHAAAVRALGDGFGVADRTAFLERHRHRTLVVRQRRAVRPIKLPGHAPFVAAERRACGRRARPPPG